MTFNSPLINTLRQHWESQTPRDQLALKILGIASVAFIVYFFAYLPSLAYKEKAERQLEKSVETYQLIDQNKQLLRSIHQNGGGNSGSLLEGNALISAITSSAKQNGLSLKRVEPTVEGRVRVWLDESPYKPIAKWIQELQSRFTIVVADIRIDKDDKKQGVVSAKITFSSQK